LRIGGARGVYPGAFSEECANKRLIFARVRKSVEVIENKGRKIHRFLEFFKKSERVKRREGILGLRRGYHGE
jgi:hypothetical protein